MTHAANASASSMASLVPEPMEKCAVCPESPSRAMFLYTRVLLRIVRKAIHLLLFAMRFPPAMSSLKISAMRSMLSVSLTPGGRLAASTLSSPARCHVSSCISTMNVLSLLSIG